jgi:homocysteine S-methyltransferase
MTTSPAYQTLERIWEDGGVVLLDGGVGSELEQVGYPSEQNIGGLWGTKALYDAPDLAKEVHRRYVSAGADVITTNTWRIDGVAAAEAAGTLEWTNGSWREKARLAVDLVREAIGEARRDAEVAVAFSVFPEPMEPRFAAEVAEVIAEAKPDLILAETAEVIPDSLEFPVFEPLLATGIPFWVAYRRCADGLCDLGYMGIHREWPESARSNGDLFGRAAERLQELGAKAVLINCLPRELVPGTLPLLGRYTTLPLGVYPNIGRFINPGWEFDETATPEAYAMDALRWRDEEGATIVGGCCGTTAEHIAAVRRALDS